jgi:hypothetical protein
MRENIAGRVARMNLRPSKALLPLFEAVSNSIDAIEALRGDTAGTITVELTRDPTQKQMNYDADRAEPITSIRITDDGIGFTEANMTAFEEADTPAKLEIGGKGVGRFTWLKVFRTVTVESTYRAADGYRRRRFRFSLPDGIQNVSDTGLSDQQASAPETSVTLDSPLEPYRAELQYRATTIAANLVRHFLSYLITSAPPRIAVIEGDQIIPVTADDIAARETGRFSIDGHSFTIEHLKIRSPERKQRKHAAYYCARRRVVKEEPLRNVPDGRLPDGEDGFFYHAYVMSPYLDSAVNELRTGLDIDDEQSDISGPSLGTIREEVAAAAKQYLQPQLTELRTDRDDRVRRVIERRVPELAYVQEENADIIENLPLDATEAEVEEAIGTAHLRNQRTGRELLSSLVQDLRSASTINLETFERELDERIERVTRPSQASLASYVLYRRAIIEMYREVMKKSGDRFQREALVHKLLFPMGAELDNLTRVDHNLWLLDERLTFADYIASDKPLNQHRVLFDVESKDEPDIACYFNLGFSEEDPAEGDLKSVVIVELKRPGPVASRPENPWQQVIRYIDQIQDGLYAEGGQKIKATSETRFYCYIVCDLDNPTIAAMRREHQFRPIFSGTDGYFLYNDELRAYAELVPFEKVLRDAERKHRAFFERLGLPR